MDGCLKDDNDNPTKQTNDFQSSLRSPLHSLAHSVAGATMTSQSPREVSTCLLCCLPTVLEPIANAGVV